MITKILVVGAIVYFVLPLAWQARAIKVMLGKRSLLAVFFDRRMWFWMAVDSIVCFVFMVFAAEKVLREGGARFRAAG